MAAGHYETRRAVIGYDANDNPIWGSIQVWVPDPPPTPTAPKTTTTAPKTTTSPVKVPTAPTVSDAQREAAQQLLLKQRGALENLRRKRAEEALANQRRQSYDALKRRAQLLISPDATAANLSQEQLAEELARTSKAFREAEAAERTRFVGGVTEDVEQGESKASRKRRQQIERARQTGDYVAVIEYVEAQQEATGGRYVDRELLDFAITEFNAIRDKARDTFETYLDQFYQLEAAGDYTKLVTLYNSGNFQSAMTEYVRLFGDGREEGVAHRFAGAQNRIAEANDRYLERSILGASFYGRLLTDSELERRRAELEEQLIRRGRGGPGPQEFAEDQHRISMAQFLRESELGERDRLSAEYDRYQRALRLARQEGFLTPEGEIANVTQDSLRQRDVFVDLWHEAGLSDEDLKGLIEQLGGAVQVDRDRALRELYQQGMRAWAQRNRRLFGGNPEAPVNRDSRAGVLYRAARDQFRAELWRYLTGQDKPRGLEGDLVDLSMDPIGGPILQALSLPVGLVGAGLRSVTSTVSAGGQLRTPDIHFFNPNEPFAQLQTAEGGPLNPLSGWLPFLGLDTSRTTKSESRRAMAELQSVYAGGDLGRSIEATSAYGLNWAGGNTAGLISTAFDPLTYTGVGNFLRAGRLALARAGGLRAAMVSPLMTADDFLRLSIPRSLGGYDRAMVRELLDRQALARQLKLPYERVAGMSPDELRELAASTLGRTPAQIKRLPAWARLFREDPANAQQLLNAALEAGRELARQRGARVVNVVDLEKRVRQAEETVARVEREAQSTARRQASLATEALQARAAERVRTEIARKQARAGQPPAHVPVRVAQPARRVRTERRRVERLLGEAEVERLEASRGAAQAAEVLRTSRNAVERRAAADNLARLLRRVEDLERAGNTARPGLLVRRRADYERFLRDHGLSQDPPRFLGVSALGVSTDRQYVTAALIEARRRLSGSLTATQRRWWERRVQTLTDANEYFDLEERLLSGASRVSKGALAQFGDDVRGAFSLNQVTARALTGQAGREELVRDVHKLLRRVGDELPMNPATRRRAARAVPALRSVEIQITPEIRAEMGNLLDGVDLFTALRVMRDSARTNGPGAWIYRNSADEVGRQVGAAMRAAGLGQPRDMAVFLDLLERGGGTGRALGWREYRQLDAKVTQAIQEARQFIARGQLRAGRVRGGKRRALPVPDSDPRVILAKIRVLDQEGVGLRQYEELRGLFRNAMLRFERGSSLRRRARVRARQSGREMAEEFDELRAVVRDEEAMRALERFASENPGLTEGELVSRFQEEFIHRDLVDSQLTVTPFGRASLEKAFRELSGVADLGDAEAIQGVLTRHNAPPLGNRKEMRDWLVTNGQWSPRTADDIRSGQRVWSIADQRAYWQGAYGYTPPWTDPTELAKVLDDSELYRAQFTEWGFFDEDFDRLISAHGIEPREVAGQIVWGGEGIARARTYEELRQWAIDTYGDLVSPDGQTLTAMPWLMDPRAPEYRAWLDKMFAAGFVEPELRLRAAPLEIDRTLIRPEQIEKLSEAVMAVTQRRIQRAVKLGDVVPGETWLPQEQLLFAYEVTNELLLNPTWRSLLQRRPGGLRALSIIGAFFRLPMVWTLAFPVMNLIDAFGLKRGLLMFVENGGRPLSRVRPEIRERIPNLSVIGGERTATWYLRAAGGWEVARDSALSRQLRARGFLQGVVDLPLTLSKWGEDHLRLDFGRAVYQRAYDDFIRAGVDAAEADVRALAQARRLIAHYFPSLETAGEFEKAFNQIVPFFSYNVKNKLISLELALSNPWIILVADRLGDFVEEQNRANWEAEHPGIPFPIDGNERRIHVRIGDTEYTIDLSTYSDWSRGAELLFQGHTPDEWVYEFFRAPHPSQAIFFAWAFGFNDGMTPWGTPVRWEELSIWAEFASWLMNDPASFDPNNPRSKDHIQILSQLLFFKAFGRVSPIKAKVQTFFALMAVDEDKAWAYYRDNPDVRAFFMLDGTDYRPSLDESQRLPTWFRHRSPEEVAAFEAAQAEYDQLKGSYDARLAEFYLRPWDPAYRALRKERRETLALFLRAHPILADVWGFYRTRQEWAEEFDEWKTDLLVDEYFALDKLMPSEGAYDSEVEYLKALDAFYDAKRLYLEAHPDVYDRLHFSHNAVERAWFDHELMWSETLDRIAGLRIKIAEEEARPEPNRDLINLLYDLSEASYLKLNAESFGQFYDLLDAYRGEGGLVPRLEVPGLIDRALGRLRNVVVFPGRADFMFERATPAERDKIMADERYIKDIKAFVNDLSDPRLFWVELAKRPDLLKAYLARNPEREVDYRYSVGIGAIVRRARSGKHFYELLAADPWLMAEYFRRHPDKAAAFASGQEYFSWISRWIEAIKGGDSQKAQRVWDSMPAWVRDRYFARHPDSGMASVDGVSYFSAISGWVDLLRAKRYDEADTYFRNLPDWVQERYFSKHPDQRAKHELESSVLRAGAEYFLAAPGDKAAILERYPDLARWLNQYGGNEAAFRGLIFAIYRAIPSSEPWLKRTFRERYPELFGKEAQGQRRLRKVADMLVRNPEMAPFYERALALQTRLYEAQLRRGGAPPKPLSVDRRRRLAQRRRKRRSRFSAHWRLHKDLRG